MNGIAGGPDIAFVLLLMIALSISLNYLIPSRTEEILQEWEAKANVEIIRAIPLNRPWSFKWGLFSQAQHFVRVRVKHRQTGSEAEMVLCLGNLIFGLKVKRV
jgi:hypothetical protein